MPAVIRYASFQRRVWEHMEKHRLFISVSVFSLALALYFAYSSGTALDDYIPKNEDEGRIIDVMVTFQTAKQQFDSVAYLSCLDENGTYMFGGHLMVSKKELRRLLPEFWAGLKTINTHNMPISRENLNGNYLEGSFFDPIISVTDTLAEVTVTFETPVIKWRTLLFINLVKKHNRWLIQEYRWDMG